MRGQHREPSLDEVLSEPIVLQLMASDRVRLVDVRAQLEALRRVLADRASGPGGPSPPT